VALGEDFERVLRAARLGEEWAWAAIYRDLSPFVLRYLKAHGACEPEDLLGEVFVGVVRKVGAFDGREADFRAWVFTIARNRLTDEWRRRRRDPCQPVIADDLEDLRGSAAEEDVSERDAIRHVVSVIERLSTDQRDVLFLRIVAGLTVEEVARVVAKSPGAVKALQVRGLEAIRREISREAVSV
jgi:RNA polymerase sigma factor (sigma-70 family)